MGFLSSLGPLMRLRFLLSAGSHFGCGFLMLNGSLPLNGFLSPDGSLLDDRFLLSCSSLNIDGFLVIHGSLLPNGILQDIGPLYHFGFLHQNGSLYPFGFLLNSGPLLVFGFLPLSCSLKYSMLIYACGLCQSPFDVFHVERQDARERRAYTVFSKLDSPLYPEKGSLVFYPIPPPFRVSPGRNEHEDKIVIILP